MILGIVKSNKHSDDFIKLGLIHINYSRIALPCSLNTGINPRLWIVLNKMKVKKP